MKGLMARPRTPISSYGAVSIVELQPGRWRARTRYRFEDGKVRQVERFAQTKGRARAKLAEALADVDVPSTSAITASSPLAVLGTRFIEYKSTTNVTARTIDTYRQTVKRIIAPGVGSLSVREATTERLDRFLGDVVKDRGPGAAKITRSVLSGMMSYAVRLGAGRINPVREVSSVTQKPSGAVAIPSEDMPQLLGRVRCHPALLELDLPDLIEFLAGTAVRISEALALDWDHVELEGASVEITRNVVRARGQGLIVQDHTKTDASMRVLAIPQHIVEMLRKRRLAQVPNVAGLVFPTVLGNLHDRFRVVVPFVPEVRCYRARPRRPQRPRDRRVPGSRSPLNHAGRLHEPEGRRRQGRFGVGPRSRLSVPPRINPAHSGPDAGRGWMLVRGRSRSIAGEWNLPESPE
jgi:integrase